MRSSIRFNKSRRPTLTDLLDESWGRRRALPARSIELPEFAQRGVWRDIYTQQKFENVASLAVSEIFAQYPFACLERVTE